MPFCPVCKYEYKSGVKVCPDCGSKLVARLKPEKEQGADDDVKSVLLLKTDNYLKAELVAGALDEAGISFWAKRLGTGSRLGGMATGAISHDILDAPKPAEIYVLPDDLEEAKEIMQGFEGDFDVDDDYEDEEDNEEDDEDYNNEDETED
jgi:hypothetical protein